MNSFKALIFLTFLLPPVICCADESPIWELRGYYAYIPNSPDQLNDTATATRADWPDHKSMSGFGISALRTSKKSRLGGGLLFEMLGSSDTKETLVLGLPTSLEYSMSYTRIAPFARFLIFDSERYFLGCLFSVNLLPRFRYEGDLAGERIIEYTAKSAQDYSLGLDFGFNMSYVTFGFDVGYLKARAKSVKNELTGQSALNSNGGGLEIDLSGPYFHILAGFRF